MKCCNIYWCEVDIFVFVAFRDSNYITSLETVLRGVTSLETVFRNSLTSLIATTKANNR